MKSLSVCIALIVSGCASRSPYVTITEYAVDQGLYKIKDKKNNTVCYIYRDEDNSSLSCVKD